MLFTPFAFWQQPEPTGIPTSGLVAWYDAADYTSGFQWADRSGNNYTIFLNGTFSKVASPITAVYLNNGWANFTSGVPNWGSATAVTHVEIIRPTVVANFAGTFAIIGTNTVSSFQFDGTGRIYTWVNGKTGFYLNGRTYATTKTAFIARRFSSGFTNTGNTLIVDYADSAGVSLTKYGSGNFILGRAGNTTYTLGLNSKMNIGSAENNVVYDNPGYYGANLYYNRILTDSEITRIYNYYKPLYSLS